MNYDAKSTRPFRTATKQGKFWRRYAAQAGLCAICAAAVPPERMTRDHIVPRVAGGSPDWDNIQLTCEPCNTAKGATIPPNKLQTS